MYVQDLTPFFIQHTVSILLHYKNNMSGMKGRCIVECFNDDGPFPPLMAKDGLRDAAISPALPLQNAAGDGTGDMGHVPS